MLSKVKEIKRMRDPSYYFYQGNNYLDQGDYSRAISAYNKALKIDPNFVEAYCNRGVAYGRKQDFDQAISNCNKAIEINPNVAEAYKGRGNTHLDYRARGETFIGRVENYGSATGKPIPAEQSVEPVDWYSYHSNKATDDFTKAININRDDAKAYKGRGTSYYLRGEYEKAISDITQAIRINPNDEGAYNNRALAYNGIGDYEKALEDHTKAIEIDPDCKKFYQNRAEAYEERRDYDRAISDYTKAFDFDRDPLLKMLIIGRLEGKKKGG